MNLKIPKKLEFLVKQTKRYKVAYGGRGAAKSWTFADCLLALAVQKKLRVLCVRELQTSIKDSVHRLLADRVKYHNLDKFFQVTESEIRGANGSLFLFKGLRSNIAEIKSLEGVNYCWVEEAQKVSHTSWELLVPTIRTEHSEIWISFNTGGEGDPVYQRFVTTKRNDAIVVKVNYYDNPWFPDVLRNEMEFDKKNNPSRYDNVWEGNPGSEGRFFIEFGPHLLTDPFQIEPSTLEGRLFGSLDHGTTHATSFGLWYIDANNIIYRLCSYYATGGTVAGHVQSIHDTIESFTWTMGYFPERVWADPSMWTQVKKNEFDVWSPIQEYETYFKEHGHKTQFVKANNDKVNGSQVMRFLFRKNEEGQQFKYFSGYNTSFVDGILFVDTDQNDKEKYAKQDGDDAADEARYGLVGCWGMTAVLRQRQKFKKPKTHLENLLAGKYKKRAPVSDDWYNA